MASTASYECRRLVSARQTGALRQECGRDFSILIEGQEAVFSRGGLHFGKGDHRILPPSFRFKQGVIGIAEEIHQAQGVIGIRCHPATDGNMDGEALRVEETVVRNRRADLFGQHLSGLAVVIFNHQDKLIAAIADPIASLGEKGLDDARQFGNGAAAVEMAVGVDHLFELIDIDEDNGDRPVRRFVEARLQGLVEIAGVIQPGEIIQKGQLAIAGPARFQCLLGLAQRQVGPDPGEQFLPGRRFDDVILSACRKAGDNVVPIVAGGDENNGDVGGTGIFLDDPAGFDSRYARHVDVQKNKVRQEGFEQGQRPLTAGGQDHLVAGLGEHRSQQFDDDRIVVDDQDGVISCFLFLRHASIVKENEAKVKTAGRSWSCFSLGNRARNYSGG